MARAGIVAYRGLWDVPTMFVVKWRKRLILFDCPFDEQREDFADHYLVYELPVQMRKHLAPPASWKGLGKRGKYLGQVSVDQVSFDKSRRESIDDGVLRNLVRDDIRQTT